MFELEDAAASDLVSEARLLELLPRSEDFASKDIRGGVPGGGRAGGDLVGVAVVRIDGERGRTDGTVVGVIRKHAGRHRGVDSGRSSRDKKALAIVVALPQIGCDAGGVRFQQSSGPVDQRRETRKRAA